MTSVRSTSKRRGLQDGQGGLGVGGHLDVVAGRPEVVGVDGPREALVVDEEDRVGHRRQVYHGRRELTPLGAQGAALLGRRRAAGAAALAAAGDRRACRRGRRRWWPAASRCPTACVSTVLGLPAGAGPLRAGHRGARPRRRCGSRRCTASSTWPTPRSSSCPAHTLVPQPSPFAGALVVKGEVALELAVSSLGFAPLAPAEDPAEPPPVARAAGRSASSASPRGPLTFGGAALAGGAGAATRRTLAPVPLTPPSHRGLLYHGRAIHPVIDVGVFFGAGARRRSPRRCCCSTPAGAAVGVVADRVLGLGRRARGRRRCSGRPGTRSSERGLGCGAGAGRGTRERPGKPRES